MKKLQQKTAKYNYKQIMKDKVEKAIYFFVIGSAIVYFGIHYLIYLVK